jgi:hypothetical protein
MTRPKDALSLQILSTKFVGAGALKVENGEIILDAGKGSDRHHVDRRETSSQQLRAHAAGDARRGQ